MSYQQTASHSENTYNRSASNVYAQPSVRTHRNSQGQASFPQGTMAGSQNEGAAAMNALMNQFGGLALPTPNMASLTATQFGLGGQQCFYNPQDNSFVNLVPNMYPAQPLAPAQHTEGAYGPYASVMPYFTTQGAYPGYIPSYPLMPYNPNRSAGYYADRSDQLHKEVVPGLENRRGSYSTTESVPGTPSYYSVSQREQGTQIVAVNQSPFGSTPSPQQLPIQHAGEHVVKPLPYKTIPINIDLDGLLVQHPAIPRAVPAVFTPRENMRTLDQSLSNPIPNNRNVYIRGLHPQTDDETLAAYASRFGKVETSKAIIDTSTGACKGFGFAKYFSVRDSELCIRGFYKLGYEVGFARESFNSRLKAEGDETSTNLYVSNLPKNMTESELGAIFMDYTVQSSRILRDHQNNSRGVGFARFESREICEEIIRKFHGQPIGEEGLLLQVRYADTPAQKDLKRVTTERRQFRTNEYNVGAYGGTPELLQALSPPLSSATLSPLGPRTAMLSRHFAPRSSGSWKRETSVSSYGGSSGGFKDLDRHQVKLEVSLTEPSPNKPKVKKGRVADSTPTVSDDGSADGSADDGVTIHNDSPAIAHGGSSSPTARKS